jgi:ribonuclease Z
VRGTAIVLPDGRLIRPDDVLGPDLPGARYVHIGDVGRTDNILQYVQDAHALVIEATYLNTESDMARQFGHMTAAQAAQLAVDANVKTLILTHISRRSRERDVLAEAQAIFPNSYVARDFDAFLITKDRPVEKLGRDYHPPDVPADAPPDDPDGQEGDE